MMTMEQVLEYLAQGYAVYLGSYYGESLVESAEELREEWEDVEDDEWLYVESVDVDDETRAVHVFVGDDE